MEFATRKDIEAPIAFVFQQVTDFTSFERQALRRGADVRRRDALTTPDVGMGWDVNFTFRGKERALSAEITEFDRPNGYRVTSVSSALDGEVVVDLLPLSRGRTRLSVDVKLGGKSLGARLMLQSLRLARGNLNKQFQNRVGSFARDITERYAKRG